jgi:hypothetical protein
MRNGIRFACRANDPSRIGRMRPIACIVLPTYRADVTCSAWPHRATPSRPCCSLIWYGMVRASRWLGGAVLALALYLPWLSSGMVSEWLHSTKLTHGSTRIYYHWWTVLTTLNTFNNGRPAGVLESSPLVDLPAWRPVLWPAGSRGVARTGSEVFGASF